MYLILQKRLKQILKVALFFTAYYSGVLHLLIFALTRLRKQHCASILFYHRFFKGSLDSFELSYLDIREFKKQMRYIKKWYHVITMDELACRLIKRINFPSPSVAITIDDGYLSAYNDAFPILKEFNLPATIYLTTGFIGTNKAPWVDDLMDMLLLTKVKVFSLPEIFGNKVLDISTLHRKSDTFIRIFEVMVRLEHPRKILVIQKLSKILGERKVHKDNAERKMLNWDEVMEMSRNKISFGAHTVNHPTLSKMDLPDAEQEVYDSKKAIEKRLGNKVVHFAIPNGKNNDFSEDLKQYCKNIGLGTVVSAEPGVVYPDSDRYFLKRILPLPPMHIFACQLARYMFLKKPFSGSSNDKNFRNGI